MDKEFNMMMVGLRAHDLVKIAQIFAQAAIKEGMKIVGTDHTFVSMEQMVEISHIRVGEEVFSPFIPKGKCDLLIGFLPGEGARLAAEFLKSSGIVIFNTKDIVPLVVMPPHSTYPEPKEILDLFSPLPERLITLDAYSLARETGDKFTVNFVMLGAASSSGVLPVTSQSLKGSIEELVPERELEVSLKAFELGQGSISGCVTKEDGDGG